MTTIYLAALGSATLVSILSFLGALAIPVSKGRWINSLVGLSVGALLGDAFIHLIPEAYEHDQPVIITSLSIIAGIILFFGLAKVIHWHHHTQHQPSTIKPYAYSILIGDGLHNFIDGILIGAAFLVSFPVGIATTVAVILHEIPQEIGDFAVLINAGYTRTKALLYNFFSSLAAISGTLLVLIVGQSLEQLIFWLIPLAAGGFIYIACTDLVPELHKENPKGSWVQFLFIFIGVGLMMLLLLLE